MRAHIKNWGAVYIAALALLVSVCDGLATRRHNTLTARPYLRFNEQFAPEVNTGLVVLNSVAAVAIIDDFRIYDGDRELKGDDWRMQWKQFIDAHDLANISVRSGALRAGDTAGPGLAEIILVLQNKDHERYHVPDSGCKGVDECADLRKQKADQYEQDKKRLRAALEQLGVRIVYHSIYGEKFSIERRGSGDDVFHKENMFGRFVPWPP